MKTRTRTILVVLVLVVAALVFALSGHRVPAGQPPLHALNAAALSSLQQEFNHHPDDVRVILLLSPT
jgi:hypothetical protein